VPFGRGRSSTSTFKATNIERQFDAPLLHPVTDLLPGGVRRRAEILGAPSSWLVAFLRPCRPISQALACTSARTWYVFKWGDPKEPDSEAVTERLPLLLAVERA